MDKREVNPSKIGIENEAIYRILVKILEKWRVEVEAEQREFEETVILSPQGATSGAFPSPTVKLKDMGLEEKMVFSKETDRMSSKQKAEEPELKETVILSPREAIGNGFPSPPLKSKDMGLDETMASQKEIDRMGSAKGSGEQSKENEFLEETIILKPRKLQGRDKDKVNG